MNSTFIKFLKISSTLFLGLIASVFGYFLYLHYNIPSTVVGNSMCFEGYCEGDAFVIRANETCDVGAVCVFRCNSSKCLHPGVQAFKFVKETSAEGYFFVGDPKPFACTTDPSGWCHSIDSNVYGFIDAPDIEIIGVVAR